VQPGNRFGYIDEPHIGFGFNEFVERLREQDLSLDDRDSDGLSVRMQNEFVSKTSERVVLWRPSAFVADRQRNLPDFHRAPSQANSVCTSAFKCSLMTRQGLVP
jgi:hypothetical protein